MTTVKVALQPAAIVRVYPPDEAPVSVSTTAGAVVRVMGIGTQGRKGDPGPQGPPGPAGGYTVQRPASVNVGGHRAVAPGADGRVAHVSKADIQSDTVLGVTTGAAAAGQMATIVIAGELTEDSWDWVPGPVWLGDDGALTQVLATIGAIVRVGTAITADTIIVEPRLIARL